MHHSQGTGTLRSRTRGRTTATAIGAAAAVLVMSLCSTTPAQADDESHSEILFYSAADGGGQIVADFDFSEHVHVALLGCSSGNCVYTHEGTGLVAAEPGEEHHGLYRLDDGILFTLEIVSVSPEVSIRSGNATLNTDGQILRLGFSPFHLDPVWQLELPEGDVHEASVTFKVTSSSPAYLDSPPYTLWLSNEEEHHETTTTTMGFVTTTTHDAHSHCGDGFVDHGETCDEGHHHWSMGDHCGTDCNLLACGDPDDTGEVTVVDALHTLKTAVDLASCDLCVCDVNSDRSITPSDALLSLQESTQSSHHAMECPACE